MRIPTWRLLLTGAAIVVLTVVGVGFVAASSNTPAAPPAPPAAAASTAPGTTLPGSGGLRQQLGLRWGRFLADRPFARRLVHATITVTGQGGSLVTFQLDHGTIASIGNGSLTISESGGESVTVSTDANTVVFLGGGAGRGSLGDLKVGDQIFVQSRLDGGTALAKHVLRIPTTTGS